MNERRCRIAVDAERVVSGHWLTPGDPTRVAVLAHGAGNDMEHPFMRRAQTLFCAHGAACLRFNFPYKERGGKAPDRAPLLETTWRAALDAATAEHGDLPLIASGKSLGARMASHVVADPAAGARIAALVCLGYPLHPAGKPERERSAHFPQMHVPVLFVQGTRDRLCDLELLEARRPTLGGISTLHTVVDGDHSFRIPKRSGQSEDDVWHGIARALGAFLDAHVPDGGA